MFLYHIHVVHRSKFQVYPFAVTQGLRFDIHSIMLYRHNQYSKNELSTLVPVNNRIPKEILGNTSQPSQQDYLDISLTYCGEPSH